MEITEFPALAAEYGVRGVPQTMINGGGSVLGAVPEAMLIEEILKVLGK